MGTTKTYTYMLPGILSIDNKVCPATFTAESPREARQKILKTLSDIFKKVGIQIELNGITTITETDPETGALPIRMPLRCQ